MVLVPLLLLHQSAVPRQTKRDTYLCVYHSHNYSIFSWRSFGTTPAFVPPLHTTSAGEQVVKLF